MKLSVAIITFNEEDNIARTIAAVRDLADEIVVLDSFSADRTVEIARELGAKVFQQEFAGYIGQKNDCMAHCSGDWILSIDADEEVSPDLAASIRAVMEAAHPAAGYVLNRRTFYMGKLLKYAWQPDRKLRLVRRSANPRWTGSDPHEHLEVDGKTEICRGDLIHYSYRDFDAHMAQTRKFARQIAESYHARGKKSGFAALLFKPCFILFKRLILQRGILDGVPGLMAGLSSAAYVYMKYAYLWEMRNMPPAGR